MMLRKWLRAYRVSRHRKRLDEAAWIEWAANLNMDKPVVIYDSDMEFRSLGESPIGRRIVSYYEQ